jgi:hypothetical protein
MLTGFVAFLDVLGFSALVSGEAHDQRIYEYLNALQDTLNTLDAGPTVEYVVFSDSIVITTRDDSDASFISLMARCSVTFGTLLKHEIAVRGAIAHGTFVTSKTSSGTFVAGRAIIEAYKYETKQDWTGIMLAPSVVRKISNLSERCEFQDPSTLEVMQQIRGRLPYIACLQPCAVPFHNEEGDSSAYQGYAIVPTLGK